MDALLALAAFAVTGLVATVAILWLVPLLLAAAIAGLARRRLSAR